jgi:hypothetical protein
MTNLGASNALGSMLSIILFGIAVEQMISLLSNYLLALEETYIHLIYLGLLSAYFFIIPTLFVFLLRPSLKINKSKNEIDSAVFIFIMSAIGYFGIWLLLGLALGQHPVDVIGSTGRVLIPFLVCIITISGLSFVAQDVKIKFYKLMLLLLLIFTTAGALGKIYLMSQGLFYGMGLNQFGLPIFLLSWMTLFSLNKNFSRSKRIFVAIGLMVFVFLSLLSLKRAFLLEIIKPNHHFIDHNVNVNFKFFY